MDMNIFPFLPFLALYGVVQAEIQYYISQTDVTTGDVPSSCTLAAPQIKYREDGNFIDINKSQIHDPGNVLTQGHACRIGYVEEYAAFTYEGCIRSSDLISKQHRLIQNSPGQCYSLCKTNYVGLQERTCHCIDSFQNASSFFRDGCTSVCKPIATGALCGGPNNTSVYQISKNASYTPKRTQNKDIECLVFVPSGGVITLSWYSCSGSYRTICLKADMDMGQWHHRGVVKLNNDELKLFFSQSQPVRFALCENATESISTTQPKTMSTCITLGMSGDSNDSMASTQNGSSEAVIYTMIPVSLVVIAGVLVFILWKMRLLPICKHTDEDIQEKTSSPATIEIKLEHPPDIQESQRDYHILEPMDQYESVQESVDDESNENDYDTTTTGANKENQNFKDSSNVYNKLDIMPTYSHIAGTVNLAMHSDDTYNHIESKSSENMYDSTTSVENSERVNKHPDDTYSKVNK